MAENAMQGIMGLDEAPAMPGMGQTTPPPMPQNTPEEMAAFEQARQQLDPREVSQEILSAAEEIDPAEVQELRQLLAGMQLPPELLGAMLTMVEMILAEPGNYATMREEFIKEGVPEEILPAQFDAEYFGGLELALEQLDMQSVSTMPPVGSMQPIGFADGGIVSLKPIAKELQSYGRNGDTMLAHITPQEARMLKRMGGSGTINPVTGLPEFFLGGVVKSVGNAFKSVGKAVVNGVKSVAKGVQKFAKSPVGKIAIGTALFFLAGPAAVSLGITSGVGAATFQGVVAGFGSSILGGENLKTSLRNGAIGGVTAGATAGVMGGAEAFQAGSYTGAQSYGELFDNAKSGIGSLFGSEQAAGAEAMPVTGGTTIPGEPLPPIEAPALSTSAAPAPSAQPGASRFAPPAPTVGSPAPTGGTPSPGIFDRIKSGVSDFAGTVTDFLTPGSGVDPTQAGLDAVSKLPAGTSEAIQLREFDRAVAAATPGILSKYGPYAAAGLGVMSLTGGFDEQDTTPEISEYDRLKADLNPEDYEINLGGVETTYNTPMGTDSQTYTPYQDFYASMAQNPYAPQNPQAQTFQPQQPYAPNTMLMAQGGSANTKDFPRKTGPINGPGTEKSDSIPAMLSDGEFVYTAKAVRGAGNGSRRAGAKRMYQMMKEFERNA
jgi:hypothetical protein